MKTRFTYIAAGIFFSMMLMLTPQFIFGQGRYNRGNNSNARSARSEYPERRSRADYDRNTYQPVTRSQTLNRGENHNAYTYEHSRMKGKHGKAYGHYKHGHKKYGHPGKGHAYGHHKNKKVVIHHYHTPRTFNVWHYPAPWEYKRHAFVFRHTYGDFYFHHGRFYRYHPRRGYYRVDIPSTVVFSYLPIGYQEVMIDGYMYYRYGDTYFEYTPAGYRIIRPPRGTYIAAQF